MPKTKKRWTVAESTLDKFWRIAVRKVWGHRCARCGATNIECHHIVARRHKLLRWDYRNGICLCSECHQWADTGAGRAWCRERVDTEYLDYLERWTLSDWCARNGISKDEFRLQKKEELTECCI